MEILPHQLKKLGFEKKPSEDSRAFLSRIEASDVIQTTEIEVIINLYNKIKYGPDHTNKDTNQSDLKTLNLLINNFETLPGFSFSDKFRNI